MTRTRAAVAFEASKPLRIVELDDRAPTSAGRFAAQIITLETANGPHAWDEGIRDDATLDAIGSVKSPKEAIAQPNGYTEPLLHKFRNA